MHGVMMQQVFNTPEWKQAQPFAREAWLTMATYVDPAEGNVFYRGHEALADDMGKSTGAVSRAVKALVTAGLLEVLHPGGGFHRSEYRLIIPRTEVSSVVVPHLMDEGTSPHTYEAINEKSDGQAARGITPYNPQAETSGSTDDRPQPPLTQGRPQIFILPFDPQYKSTRACSR